MVRFIRAGQPIPPWLERVEVTNPTGEVRLVAGTALVVTRRGLHFHVRPLLPGFRALMVLEGNAERVIVSGQSPKGGDGDVFLWSRPVIGPAILGFIAGACLCVLLKG